MATVTYDSTTCLFPGSDTPAVDRLQLDIADGEFLVLVGPSGCGKSTSLRMLAGLEDVHSGRVLIGDRDLEDVRSYFLTYFGKVEFWFHDISVGRGGWGVRRLLPDTHPNSHLTNREGKETHFVFIHCSEPKPQAA